MAAAGALPMLTAVWGPVGVMAESPVAGGQRLLVSNFASSRHIRSLRGPVGCFVVRRVIAARGIWARESLPCRPVAAAGSSSSTTERPAPYPQRHGKTTHWPGIRTALLRSV